MKHRTLLRAGLLSWAVLFSATALTAGYYYESTTTTRAEGQRGTQVMAVKAWVDGDKSRIEFVDGERSGPMAVGNYLVSTDGGETVHLVNPKEKTYGKFSLKDMMAGLGQAMDAMKQMGGMMKMEFTDLSTEKLLEEPGEEILGQPTTHYRYKSNYTMNMAIMMMKQTIVTESIQDIWSTDAIDAAGFGVWLNTSQRGQTGNEEFDKLFDQELGKVNGFPLKMVSETTMTDRSKRPQKSTTTLEVTALREETVADEVFTWPDTYTETEIIPAMPELPAAPEGQGFNPFRRQ